MHEPALQLQSGPYNITQRSSGTPTAQSATVCVGGKSEHAAAMAQSPCTLAALTMLPVAALLLCGTCAWLNGNPGTLRLCCKAVPNPGTGSIGVPSPTVVCAGIVAD